MNGFFKWFKSGAKIKRWIFLMIVGIILVCYGMAKVLVTDQMSFVELAKIVLIFILGFTFTIISIVCIQRRTLEMFVEESDTRELEDASKVKSLIFNRKIYNQGPKVVVIGGGAGLNTVLRGLKNYTDNITAIVTVSDYGIAGSKSRNELGALPLEDIKDSLIALSTNEAEMENLLNLEINNPKLKGLKFGDVYLTAMKEAVGDFAKSIEESKKILNMTGKVIPVTLDKIKICAELEDGTVVESRDKIPEMVSKKVSKITRIYISPTNIRVAPGVIEAIKEADSIVIGPGSLYTNVIPNLLVPGVSKAIKEAKGFKVYVSNIMTEYGQTDNYSLYDHIKAIIDHAGKGIIDYCIYDTGEIVPEYIRQYNKEGSDLVEQDAQKVKAEGIKLIQRNLSTIENDRIRHNPDAIATSIIQLICDDLKFRDMQNDAQFIMLDSKIKDTKKKLNKNKKKKSKNKKRKGSNSKFYEKYNERIQSIQESSQAKTKTRPKTKEKTQTKSKVQKQESTVNEPKKKKAKTSKPQTENRYDLNNKRFKEIEKQMRATMEANYSKQSKKK
ncbi:MAG: uridine diphosphate-N-acetylglucosamine-binding protein YvcK [Clostridia bacterium]